MAATETFRLDSAPIIEAIVDFQCDLGPNVDKTAFETSAKGVFADSYPEFRTAFVHEQRFSFVPGKAPAAAVTQAVRGYRSRSKDGKQILQSRFDGFSFNRLAPYSTLDDYLPEVRARWNSYVEFARPIVVKRIGLRFINRLSIPLTNQAADLGDFLKTGPMVPREFGLQLALTGFTHNHSFVSRKTGDEVNLILAALPGEPKLLPVVLDIDCFRNVSIQPSNWSEIEQIVASLRELKNSVFRATLHEKCLSSQQLSR